MSKLESGVMRLIHVVCFCMATVLRIATVTFNFSSKFQFILDKKICCGLFEFATERFEAAEAL